MEWGIPLARDAGAHVRIQIPVVCDIVQLARQTSPPDVGGVRAARITGPTWGLRVQRIPPGWIVDEVHNVVAAALQRAAEADTKLPGTGNSDDSREPMHAVVAIVDDGEAIVRRGCWW